MELEPASGDTNMLDFTKSHSVSEAFSHFMEFLKAFCYCVPLVSSNISAVGPLVSSGSNEEKMKKAAKKKRRTSSSVSAVSTDTESTSEFLLNCKTRWCKVCMSMHNVCRNY